MHGSLDPDDVESRLAQWRNGDTYALIGKPVMLGQGMNFQQCWTAVYVGLTFSFNDLIQSIHRIQRFGQTHPCTVHLIHAESEREVVTTVRTKWAQHKELTATMTDVIRKHGLSATSVSDALKRSMGVDRVEASSGDRWILAHNDCVPETESMDEGSVDLIVTSIPFANHYEYTPSYNDFGHTDDNDHFWSQMDYLTPQLLRILAPGRIYACHVKDRINFGAVTGAGVPTVSPFHAEALFHAQRHGFDYLGMITVVTDVVRENNQTYRLGWSEMAKDGTKMGVGSPEYVLIFHKPQTDRSRGYADVPVTKDKGEYTRARWQVDAHAFWRSSGNRMLTPDELAALPVEQMQRLFTEQTLRDVYDYESHVRIGEDLDGRGALPATFMSLAPGSWTPDVWHDVDRMRTLNGDQRRRNVQMHVCLARGSLVLTRRGYKPIEDMSIGDEVLTHEGRWMPVLAVQNTGIRPVVNLRANGVPGAVMTPDHKVWARDTRGFADRSFRTARRQTPGWVEAAETVGSYVNRKLAPVEPPSTD
ncbi:MAG: Hint domain-containing protein, partial [Microlunatus sp.]|nr:Hint domain-containing protein [Microlunatus sp.]